jgi:hypothetical protein
MDSLFESVNTYDRQVERFDKVNLGMLTEACARQLVKMESGPRVSERFYRIADSCAVRGGVGDFVAPVKAAEKARAQSAAQIADVEARQAMLEARLKLNLLDSARLVALGLVIGFSAGWLAAGWVA